VRGKESLGSRCKGKISAGSKYKKKDGMCNFKKFRVYRCSSPQLHLGPSLPESLPMAKVTDILQFQ
jgi:hypothetical protein